MGYRSIEMLPTISSYNVRNRYDVNSEEFCDFSQEHSTFSQFLNSKYFIFTEFRRLTFLRDLVSNIIGIGSYEQVRRIATSAIVALVQYMKIGRYRSVFDYPRNSMSWENSSSSYSELDISKFSECLKFPTFLLTPNRYFTPESLNDFWCECGYVSYFSHIGILP